MWQSMKNTTIAVLLLIIFYLAFFRVDRLDGRTIYDWSAEYDEADFQLTRCLEMQENNSALIDEFAKNCMTKENPYACTWEMYRKYEK